MSNFYRLLKKMLQDNTIWYHCKPMCFWTALKCFVKACTMKIQCEYGNCSVPYSIMPFQYNMVQWHILSIMVHHCTIVQWYIVWVYWLNHTKTKTWLYDTVPLLRSKQLINCHGTSLILGTDYPGMIQGCWWIPKDNVLLIIWNKLTETFLLQKSL